MRTYLVKFDFENEYDDNDIAQWREIHPGDAEGMSDKEVLLNLIKDWTHDNYLKDNYITVEVVP